MIIYKIINKINNKVYIGQTRQELRERIWKHFSQKNTGCPKLSKAIKKYGRENFIFEAIDYAYTQEELDKKEKYWIAKFDSVNGGYNIDCGGNSTGRRSEEFRAKYKEKFAGEKNPFFGKKHSPESIERMRKAKLGKKFSESTKKKMSLSYDRSKRIKPVVGICVESGNILNLDSIIKSKDFGFLPSKVALCCHGQRLTRKGYRWFFLKNFNNSKDLSHNLNTDVVVP